SGEKVFRVADYIYSKGMKKEARKLVGAVVERGISANQIVSLATKRDHGLITYSIATKYLEDLFNSSRVSDAWPEIVKLYNAQGSKKSLLSIDNRKLNNISAHLCDYFRKNNGKHDEKVIDFIQEVVSNCITF